jgi:hypothetical protein
MAMWSGQLSLVDVNKRLFSFSLALRSREDSLPFLGRNNRERFSLYRPHLGGDAELMNLQ